MRVMILGGDGYLGWPTAMHFAAKGEEVMVIDNFVKRRIELEEGVEPLEHVPPLHRRISAWQEDGHGEIHLRVGDLMNPRFVYQIIDEFQPHAIVHYAEQPSAPYSMQSRGNAVFTQQNNVVGTLNLLFAIKGRCPNTHLVKLGTMGEYGTPNIDIEEGYLTVTHNGRIDTFLYPKLPGSFYHLSKVHDSNNIYFVCRVWDLAATDLNQGIVYGIDTDQTVANPNLRTSFHYDDMFGTVLNRFCVQAVMGVPLTIYGKGEQTRGYLDIRDTIQCVDLAVSNPAKAGEFRVFNQFTEQFSINQLAQLVQKCGTDAGYEVRAENLENPRIEEEEHYFNAKHSKLVDLGLDPHLLTEDMVTNMLNRIASARDNINPNVIQPRVKWRN